MNNKKLVENYLEFKKMTNRSRKGIISKGSLKLYKMNLHYLEKVLENKSFKDATENDILNALKGLKPTTKNNRIITYRDFYKWLNNLDDNEPLPQCIKRIKPVKIKKDDIEYREKVITEEEYQKLLDHADKPLYKALIETLWITGGRKGAIQSIKSDGVYYDGEYTRVVLWTSKTETREVIYPDRAEHLLLWAESLQPFKGEEDEPLFVVKKKGIDTDEYKQINDQYTYVFLRRLCKKIGYDKERWVKPHDCRHTRCTQMLKEGVPETHVKTLLAFTKNTDMLRIYDHNRLKDYEDWLKDKKEVTKPTYQLLEKQKKTLEEKYEIEINEIKNQLKKKTEIDQFIIDSLSVIAKETMQTQGVEALKEIFRKHNIPLVGD